MTTEYSHSAELERELKTCKRFLDEAQAANDATRSIQLLKVFSQLHKDIEKAKIREEKYLDEKAIAAHDARLMARLIDEMKAHMEDLYAQRVTPAEAWAVLVDKIIGES